MRSVPRSTVVGVLVAGSLVLSSAHSGRVAAQALERDLYVSVVNENGVPVTTLAATDFIIREDGVSREVLRSRRATDPIDLAVLVDNSQVATRYLTDFRKGLRAFTDAMMKLDPHGEMTLIGFADRPTILVNYTRLAAEVTRAIDRFFPVTASGAYIMDAIVETSRGIERRAAERPVMAVVSADGFELSFTYHQQVLTALKASGAAMHVITIDNSRDLTTDQNRERALAFAQGTRASGGRYDNILTGLALEKKLLDLANELSNQYRVTYARPQSLIPPEKIEVAVRTSGLIARGTPLRVRPARKEK